VIKLIAMIKLKWKYNKTKHLTLPLIINNRKLQFILDTGAGSTVIDLAVARDLGLKLKLEDKRGGGVGSSSMKVYRILQLQLQLKDIVLETSLAGAIDLSHVMAGLKRHGASEIHGVIGNDILKKHFAIIDYRKKELILN
jgi:hypothetical protein